MTKIITSEADIELDPESLTDTADIVDNSKIKRLEAIRDLEALIENADNSYNVSTPDIKKKQQIDCVIKFQSLLSKNAYVTNIYLVGLNQSLIERNITEIELAGEEQKLIKLFSFYQKNIYKEKLYRKINGAARVLFAKKKLIRRNRRNVLKKNDVSITKFYAKINGKKFNLIDFNNYNWKVNEMKYAFDNNRSSIKILLVRSK